ncbi:MAG: VIT1/CCC1 transporter family protein [Chloroflexi bacterium]|nr:VIT1/CCC1 transporter family protein [Chloroflexota bacterium]MDA1270838.1 VIT1/CCC1 transporter family protein [Chloroflexota bacterium]
MASESPPMSKTERNLWSAIVAEALAYLKYNAYAHKALEEGHPEVAQVFQEVAGAETIHGMNHLRVSGALASTLVNLRTVTEGESKEYSTMYPKMIQDALDEGRQDAADSFALAMDRERHHLEVFTNALALLEAKTAASAGAPVPSIPRESFEPAPGSGMDVSVDGMTMTDYVSAATEIDRERWRVARLGRLREVVFGAQDGLLSTVALVTGVAVAVENQTTVLVAGLAAALPGMLSMATGAFLGSRAEQDVQRSEIAREALELEENPAEELAELVVLYQREGKTYEEARRLADDIAQDKDLWLRTLVEKELGISPDDTTSPVKDALTMGVAFILAAIIPILPHFFLEGGVAISVSIGAALVGLFVLGVGKGRLVQRSPLLQGLEILTIGVISAGIGFGLGDLIPRLIT